MEIPFQGQLDEPMLRRMTLTACARRVGFSSGSRFCRFLCLGLDHLPVDARGVAGPDQLHPGNRRRVR